MHPNIRGSLLRNVVVLDCPVAEKINLNQNSDFSTHTIYEDRPKTESNLQDFKTVEIHATAKVRSKLGNLV